MNPRLRAALLTPVLALTGLGLWILATPPKPLFDAVMWQPDCLSMPHLPRISKLGAHELIVQYLALDDTDFTQPQPCLIDLERVKQQTQASTVVLGGQGRQSHSENDFKTVAADRALWQRAGHTNDGYYAALELHPGIAPRLARQYLGALPRPLSVSVYAPAGAYDARLAHYVQAAVPPDVTVLLQDGVGVKHASTAQAAAVAAQIARDRPGKFRLIVECFRTKGRGFRAAWPWEVQQQLKAYRAYSKVAFDVGHYLTPLRVQLLLAYSAWVGEP